MHFFDSFPKVLFFLFFSAAILSCLKDFNPRVRKAAVTGVGKVWRHSPGVVTDHGLVDTLYLQIRDPDPSVLTFTMQTINIILEKEGT